MKIYGFLVMFVLGLIAGIVFVTYFPQENLEIPLLTEPRESANLAPKDRIDDKNIHVFNDHIEIDLKDLQGRKVSWSTFADTESMVPTLDKGCNGLEFIPSSTQDLHIGDMIAFEQNKRLIIHRIQKTGQDKDGWFAITKGDNNEYSDGKVRWSEIKYVTFGIIC
ncbi:MAG: hypothetical protein Q8L34_01780 [Candidatus Woesearchaeota archaeon]|nr:hypothetical protein [Candidatus Woesearchaeota archaeon]